MLSVIAMIIVVVAMTVDFVSGWRKAKVRHEEHTSYAASRSLTKLLIYEGIMLIGVCVDTMIHFAWAMLMDGCYFVPLLTIVWGTVLCIVEAWSVKEKADHKQRKRIDEAALLLSQVLDKETVMELLRARIKEGEGLGHREVLDRDDF